MVLITGLGLSTFDESIPPHLYEKRDSKQAQAVLLSIDRALHDAGYESYPIPEELNAGISFLTLSGEDYISLWASEAQKNNFKPLPTRFGNLVHNAASGRASIKFGLIGPNITLVSGCLFEMTELQFLEGRTKLMVACVSKIFNSDHSMVGYFDQPGPENAQSPYAFSFIIEQAIENSKFAENTCSLQEVREALSESEFSSDIDKAWAQWNLAKKRWGNK